MGKLNNKYKTNKAIAEDTMKYLLKYDFPGNVRELENIVEYLFILSEKTINVDIRFIELLLRE